MALVLGVTGSFGSGKSTVSKMFAEMGVPVLDADQAARDAVAPGKPALESIVKEFGEEVLSPEGTLDRRKLADRVFHDPAARVKLNRIVHPKVGEEMARFLQKHQDEPLVILEIPLLLESSNPRMVDKVLVVTTDEKSRFGRLHRAGFSEAEIIARLGSQMPQARKVQLADYVIANDGNLEATRRQVQDLARQLGLNHPSLIEA